MLDLSIRFERKLGQEALRIPRHALRLDQLQNILMMDQSLVVGIEFDQEAARNVSKSDIFRHQDKVDRVQRPDALSIVSAEHIIQTGAARCLEEGHGPDKELVDGDGAILV